MALGDSGRRAFVVYECWAGAVWTGVEVLIWGGGTEPGARYSPVDDRWVALPALNAPAARSQAAIVWTGTEMIVWGGGAQQTDGGVEQSGYGHLGRTRAHEHVPE
jgi:hypothetical protein